MVAHGPGQDPDTRAIVLSGAGPVFCAGGDLAWMKAQIDADRAQRLREARKLAGMLQALNTLSVPLIGRTSAPATDIEPVTSLATSCRVRDYLFD